MELTSVMRLLLILIVFVAPAVAELSCLKQGWEAYNRADYKAAITATDECIDQYGPRAMKEQSRLESAKAKIPTTGAVESAFEKKKLFDRWAVNDVATAFFVKGRAAEALSKREKLGHYKQIAISAYQSASKLSYGRCWDPQGWFWSPAEAAQDRMALLK